MNSTRRRLMLARAFYTQRDIVRDKANLERKLGKAFQMKLLARIIVLWFNDAAKDSIVTKRSLSSGGDLFVDRRSSHGRNHTSFGNESQSADSPQRHFHSKRRASVHAYSQFMSSQLRRASVDLESSFADRIALPTIRANDDHVVNGDSLFSRANDSPANHHVKSAVSSALRPSDL